ncbi:toxin VasX [Vibrio sp. LaRot3]|uniref:toxin VasX n=1 Tax=Vibrio sp. LaRot3 TaxID=2998829 RepID=UPI0022CDBDE7|nr:toxin VasX [Vibrio sp. LaRot3]MDA0150461.1 hypothetical protein [Vibrio sp. LaRot3]
MAVKYASNHACDGKTFLIEVTGIKHSPEQDFQFYDLTDMVQQESLEKKKKIDPELEDSTIYSWHWCQQKENRNVWLKVDAEGGPIKLPLFQDVSSVERQSKNQRYSMQSILPLTLLPTYDDKLKEKDRLAPVRNGYFYIFYNGKAWREIEIRTQDDYTVEFRDIDLFKYRQGKDQPFLDEQRKAVGKTLKEIWVPYKDNGRNAKVQVAFSEVPWSAPYLNNLESDEKALANRCESFQSLVSDPLEENTIPPIRVREPELEFLLAEPSKLNRSLDGSWLTTQFRAVTENISQCRNDGKKAKESMFRQLYHVNEYEYGMKQSALQQELNPKSINKEQWKTKPSKDYLEDAKKRRLRTVTLDDPLFDLRQRSFLVMAAIGYLQQVYVDMSKQEYYACAELVQKFVFPKKFGKNENTWHKHKNDINGDLGGRFHRTLRTIERDICRIDVKGLQKHVETVMNDNRLAFVLKDMSALNDINASAAHRIAGYGMSALSIDINSLDQMSNPDPLSKSPCLETVAKILSEDSQHALHEILFPPKDAVTLEDTYIPPAPFNDGTGTATPESLALWGKDDFIVNEEQLHVMDLAFMTEANDNGEDNFGVVRRAANVLDGILRGYFDALQALSEDLSKHAKVIQFNKAYAPVLGLLKATNSKLWGEMVYTPVGGAELKGTVLGVHGHGLSYGLTAQEAQTVRTKGKNAPMARLHDKSGNLIASTGRNSFKSNDIISGINGDLGKKSALKVVVLPHDSTLAETFNKESTQRTFKHLQSDSVSISNAYERLKVPYFIVVIEMMNLKRSFETVLYDHGKIKDAYTQSVLASGIIDLTLAIVHASNLYTNNASTLATVSNNTAFKMSNKLVDKFTFKAGAVKLVGKLSYLNAFSIGAGFLTAAIAGWDTIKLYQHNDLDASLAMGMITAGTLTTTVATGFFTTSSPFLFGMGPVAWIGIAIALVGFMLYQWFKDSPIETWLKNGPFGQDPSDDYAHLQDNDIAFNRFIGLVFHLTSSIHRLDSQTPFSTQINNLMKSKGATHVVLLETNIASLIQNTKQTTSFFARESIFAITRDLTKANGNNETIKPIKTNRYNSPIIDIIKYDAGYAYFLRNEIKKPQEAPMKYSPSTRISKITRYGHGFIIRATIKVGNLTLPTPPLEETQSTAIPLEPNFKNDKQWLQSIVLIK